ncbi:MAG: helix-turn-helix transcriptional regulator [Dehalococcoidia bacterium]
MGRALGEELKRLRQAKGLSVRLLARTIGVPHTTYANYERGLAVPPSQRRDALVAALGVSREQLDDLIEEDQEEVFLRARPLSEEGKAAVRDFLRLVRRREKGQPRY